MAPKCSSIYLRLNNDERKVYDEVFSFSQQAMLNYMKKHQEKEDDLKYIKQVCEFSFVKYVWEENLFFHSKVTEFGKSAISTSDSTKVPHHVLPNNLGDNKDVKAHHILVLLLRLRQVWIIVHVMMVFLKLQFACLSLSWKA